MGGKRRRCAVSHSRSNRISVGIQSNGGRGKGGERGSGWQMPRTSPAWNSSCSCSLGRSSADPVTVHSPPRPFVVRCKSLDCCFPVVPRSPSKLLLPVLLFVPSLATFPAAAAPPLSRPYISPPTERRNELPSEVPSDSSKNSTSTNTRQQSLPATFSEVLYSLFDIAESNFPKPFARDNNKSARPFVPYSIHSDILFCSRRRISLDDAS
ncbi:hypothetical protein EV126DRAFT_60621 [Verticillium dahliae]|nr:hypothetical protein EV126DRAFT_60621 [Verticillium dahliae]